MVIRYDFLNDNGIEVDRPDHPQLANLTIGAQGGTPPTFLLQRYNLMGKVRPYNLTFDPRKAVIGESMIEDLIDGLVDIVFMSGPIAVYYLKKRVLMKVNINLYPLKQLIKDGEEWIITQLWGLEMEKRIGKKAKSIYKRKSERY